MGPRLVSRGKLDALARCRERQVELQWGRDLLVAERTIQKYLVSVLCLLQWGRDLLVAESRLP